MKKEVFPYRAVEAGLRLPKIHLIVNNRVTIYNLRSGLRRIMDDLCMFFLELRRFSRKWGM